MLVVVSGSEKQTLKCCKRQQMTCIYVLNLFWPCLFVVLCVVDPDEPKAVGATVRWFFLQLHRLKTEENTFPYMSLCTCVASDNNKCLVLWHRKAWKVKEAERFPSLSLRTFNWVFVRWRLWHFHLFCLRLWQTLNQWIVSVANKIRFWFDSGWNFCPSATFLKGFFFRPPLYLQ